MSSANSTALDFAGKVEFDRILTNPILDIAARFWDPERYEAFRICYRSMRRIDDLVDDRKATGNRITSQEAGLYERMMSDWLESVREQKSSDDFHRQFIETINRFAIPLWPWERLCKAMTYDLRHDGFRSFRGFLRYCEGAAIAPASVFMHLSGITRDRDSYCPPAFEIRKAARPLALFSYLVHIIRDFQKDMQSNLNYFPLDLLHQEKLSLDMLRQAAASGKPPKGLRRLVFRYKNYAARYLQMARKTIDPLLPLLEPRFQLGLEVIFALYTQIFERIDPANGTFSTAEMSPTLSEVKERLQLTINTSKSAEK